ncbi:gluconokinase [Sphingobium sp. TCM1]|uniref:gluconokinase n=1 Tax=Sphingobium sp. TCM1 TaxID=453246 RepID=UPI0007F36303|nr:gluconokinase [Sphingobium sp. TCM1]OAN56655.1 gluconokinase [Sphingobium sp. TCM1]
MPSSADPAPPPPLAVIVMGVSGCGKSTLGALLADGFDCPFLEGDSFHAAEAVEKMRSGRPLTDEDRWPWLDRLGQAVAASIWTHGVAVAACSALRQAYRDRLRVAIGAPVRFILLEASRDRLLMRLQNRPGHYMPASLLDSQLATLERPSPQERAMILNSDAPLAELRDRSFAWLC